MEKSCRKCAPKASPRPLFNFAKLFLKLNILKEVYQKALKTLTFFYFKPSHF